LDYESGVDEADGTVVHICTDKETALKELPAICAGDVSTPQASGLGTNATGSNKQVPKGVVFGGRLPDEEYEEMTKAIQAKAPGVRVVRVERADLEKAGLPAPPPGAKPPTGPPPAGAPPFNPESIKKINNILKEKLAGI